MNKNILIILALQFSAITNAQTFNKKDFNKTSWFTENLDSLFFNADTVKLILYSNFAPINEGWDKGLSAENEMNYLGHGEYLEFQFRKHGSFEYTKIEQNYINTVFETGIYTWEFDKKRQILTVLRKGKTFFQLKPILKSSIRIDSQYQNQKLETMEFTFVKAD